MESNLERQKDTPKSVVLILATFPSAEVARQIGTELVESQLAACVNLLPQIESIYRWQGKVETAEECLAIFKTTHERSDALAAWLRERHPYEVPEILFIPVESGLSDYLAWVRESVAAPPQSGWTNGGDGA